MNKSRLKYLWHHAERRRDVWRQRWEEENDRSRKFFDRSVTYYNLAHELYKQLNGSPDENKRFILARIALKLNISLPDWWRT